MKNLIRSILNSSRFQSRLARNKAAGKLSLMTAAPLTLKEKVWNQKTGGNCTTAVVRSETGE